MADVEMLCRRVILIVQGALAYDGALGALAARLAPYKLLKVSVTTVAPPDWSSFGEVVEAAGSSASLRVARAEVPSVTARLLTHLPVADLAVVEPPLEHVIAQAYRGEMTI
jgi:ABC-2 type transport system ATP-binding protein